MPARSSPACAVMMVVMANPLGACEVSDESFRPAAFRWTAKVLAGTLTMPELSLAALTSCF